MTYQWRSLQRLPAGQLAVDLIQLLAVAPSGAQQPVDGGMDARVIVVAVGLHQPLDQRLPRGRGQLFWVELAQAQQQRPPGRAVPLGRVAPQEHVRFDAHPGKAVDEIGTQTAQAGVRAVPEQGPDAVSPDALALIQGPAPVVPVLQLEEEHGRMGLASRQAVDGLGVGRTRLVQLALYQGRASRGPRP